ncbi:MAG: RidA family protein [Dehalococcoidia bacterium]
MPDQKYLAPDTLAPTRGYSQAVQVGHTVYIAGQVGITVDGNVVSKDDPAAQARQIWHNLEAAVKAAGGSLSNIVKTTTYVTNIEYAAAAREVRGQLFPTNPPTSTLLVVSGLASPDYLMEIEAIAVVD